MTTTKMDFGLLLLTNEVMPFWQVCQIAYRYTLNSPLADGLWPRGSLLSNEDGGMLPHNILEKVKEFLIRLVKDSVFITRLQTGSADQVQSLLQDSGYDFSQEDFESATLQILDLKEQNQFHELSEEELVGAVGGWLRRFPSYPGQFPTKPGKFPIDPTGPIVQPMYGVIVEPPLVEPPIDAYPKPKPLPFPDPQPMYGVVVEPIDSIVQPMYGVVISSDS